MKTGENSSPAWVELEGTVCRGHRVASGLAVDCPYPGGSIAQQVPHFRLRGLDLESYYAGTLNISIAPCKFAIKQAQFTFRQVTWNPLVTAEDFSFVPCQLVYSAQYFLGYIYYPHPATKPDHFQNDSTLEVLCEYIPGIAYHDRVLLRINPNEIEIIF